MIQHKGVAISITYCTLPRGTVAVYIRLSSSRLKIGCGLSFTMNTISAEDKGGRTLKITSVTGPNPVDAYSMS